MLRGSNAPSRQRRSVGCARVCAAIIFQLLQRIIKLADAKVNREVVEPVSLCIRSVLVTRPVTPKYIMLSPISRIRYLIQIMCVYVCVQEYYAFSIGIMRQAGEFGYIERERLCTRVPGTDDVHIITPRVAGRISVYRLVYFYITRN